VKLNRVEKALMNNPLRALIQKHYESRLLERLGGRTRGMRVLEVGCGRGVGTDIIFKRFGAREVHAFDLDPDMVDRARLRLSSYGPDRLKLSVGDVTSIDADDRSFDAVVDFGILHHVPRWQAAVSEIRRVLRPGGRFFFEEVSSQALNRRAYRALFEHPEENRFSRDEFISELERQGIVVENNVVERLFGDFFFGVGRLPDASPTATGDEA
jgi:ubiquinone/menaquinone biosynthesis C-methylase UbiE